MKHYNLIVAVALLLLTACQTNPAGSFKWAEDGVVTGADGKKLQLDVQGVYDNLNYAGVNYLAGFKIDKEGNNYPHIVQLDDNLSSIKYWPFEQIPNDIFVYQEKIHIASMDGRVYSLQDGKWILIEQQFPRDSHIVYSDNKENLVLCYPAAMEQTGNHNSGCLSASNNWKLDFIWFTTVPKVCNGKLYIVEENGESKVVKHIDLTTGNILISRPVKNLPEDICTL